MSVFSCAYGAGQNSFHFVWKPKYVFYILIDDVRTYCEGVLRQFAQDYGYVVHALEVVLDHVHLFLSFKPSVSVSRVFQNLKGISVRRLFQKFPELRRRYWGGHLWG